MSEEKPLRSIRINLKKGTAIKINAGQIFERGVEQNVKGGTLEHRATEDLTQIGNTMEASDGGQILNEVKGGKLNQRDNEMKAGKGGVIINKGSSKAKTALLIILISIITGIVGFWSDITSLADHFLQKP